MINIVSTFYITKYSSPLDNLRTKEIEALSLLLYYRYELSRDISSPETVNVVLFSTQTRSKIREDLGGMSQKVFNNLLTSLRKKEIIKDGNKINHVLIPNMTEDGFKLVFDFEVKK